MCSGRRGSALQANWEKKNPSQPYPISEVKDSEYTKTKDGKKVKVKTKGTGKLSNPAVGTSTLNKSNAGLQIPTRNQ